MNLHRRIIALLTGIGIFHVVVFFLALEASQKYPAFLGLIFLAYGFGLRHAVDADHIAAIDNTTRKLMHSEASCKGEGKNPATVGFFFSLGHSTIVIALSALVAAGATFVNNNPSKFREVGSFVGTAISSLFLLIIGIINLIVLLDIIKIFRKCLKEKKYDEKVLNANMQTKGVFARLLRPLLKIVSKSWHMYFVGFLFGLGFDTATEVALLSISVASALNGISVWNIMLLPMAFTAGMTLIDTLNGVFMLGAYSWAYVRPLRKLYYNMNITLISVITALFIGTAEGLQLVRPGLFPSLHFDNVGFLIIIIFIVCLGVSALIYKLRGHDALDRSFAQNR